MPIRSLRLESSLSDSEPAAERGTQPLPVVSSDHRGTHPEPAVARTAEALTTVSHVRHVSRVGVASDRLHHRARRPNANESVAGVASWPVPHPAWRLALKRSVDVLGAATALVLLAPVLLVLALLIRAGSPGRPIFAHERIGRNGRRFRCYKLRTMCADAEAQLDEDGALRSAYRANHFKLPATADPRVTPLGRFLRKSSLDEIPQFWNVLRGDMSLVGPRPVVEAELAHYGAARDTLLTVRPGITGAWAVRGRSRIGYPERARIELDYVRSWTTRRDLVILLRTFGVVMQRRGAY